MHALGRQAFSQLQKKPRTEVRGRIGCKLRGSDFGDVHVLGFGQEDEPDHEAHGSYADRIPKS
jgi:hypothetical protein